MKRVKTPPKQEKFSIPFTYLKNIALGQDFELSLVFVDNVFSRRLNRIYRGKNKPADVLSFHLSKKSGEIFIDLVTARKEMDEFNMSFKEFVTFLFIHGILHLKGMRHGITMERVEKKLLNDASNYSRHRHRNLRDQGSNRRGVA